MKKRKDKKWWQHLLVIPVVLLADLIILALAGMADTAIAGDGLGHPMPVFILLAMLVCGALTVVLTLRALILCLKAIIRSRRQHEKEIE